MTLTKVAGAKLLADFRYTIPTDVTMRLKSSIVRYKGRPVLVGSHGESLDINLTDILSGESFTTHSSDEALDIASPPLGWLNCRDNCCYVMRSARNSQKQGVVPQNMYCFWPGHDHDGRQGYHWSETEELRPFAKCILNDYPTVAKCTVGFGGAFDREWALSNTNSKVRPFYYTVFHKTIPVGTYFVKTRTFFFRRGRLTKTRRLSLETIFNTSANLKEGTYGIQEQV